MNIPVIRPEYAPCRVEQLTRGYKQLLLLYRNEVPEEVFIEGASYRENIIDHINRFFGTTAKDIFSLVHFFGVMATDNSCCRCPDSKVAGLKTRIVTE